MFLSSTRCNVNAKTRFGWREVIVVESRWVWRKLCKTKKRLLRDANAIKGIEMI
jgi:hypothetical protein